MTTALPRILVVRHTETQWNAEGRLQGRQDTPLTLNGIRQAFAVAETLSSLVSAGRDWHLWTSPLGRARQTASVLADWLSLSFGAFQPVEDLVERSYGAWEGLTHPEIRDTRQDEYLQHKQDPWAYRMPGAESKMEVTARLKAWVSSLPGDCDHLVVTHSGCLRALRGIYRDATPAMLETFREPQTAAFILEECGEQMIEPTADLLARNGCENSGRSVWI